MSYSTGLKKYNQKKVVCPVCGKKCKKSGYPRHRVMHISQAAQQSFAPDSSKAGDSSLPEIVKSENALPA